MNGLTPNLSRPGRERRSARSTSPSEPRRAHRAEVATGLVIAALIASCSEAGPPRIEQGVFSLQVSADALTIEVRRGDTVLNTIGPDGFELGVVGQLDDTASYDPYWLEPVEGALEVDPPAGLRFRRLSTARVSQADTRVIELEQTFEGAITTRLRLSAEGAPTAAGARFSARWEPVSAPAIAFMRLRTHAPEGEAYYGLGEHFDQVEQRGARRAMQIEADLGIESANNEAHVPIPLLTGTGGGGLFVESKRAGVFDVARKDPARVEVTYGTAEHSDRGLTFHLFAAHHPLDVTRLYYDVTGDPLLPAPWAYGPWIWRDENRDQAEVEDDVRKIRELDLATSAIWLDRPYSTKVNSFDFDPARYTDPARMIRLAQDSGLRVALWSTPYLEEGTEPLLTEAKQRGFFPVETNLRLNEWGDPLDYTNPEVFAWWQELVRRYTELGVEGFKLDYAEDIVTGIAGGRTVWRFSDGSDERTMHFDYTPLYHRVYAETLPEGGGFLLCRAGRWGGQRYASVIWPGDLDATMTRHRERFVPRNESSEVVGVGGMPASLVAALSLGPSGYPFYGADTGGYRHSPPDRETYVRWFEQTALSSVMQVGDSSSQPPWVYTPENGRDDEVLALYRRYARLHLRLFPYAWSHAVKLAEDGRPLMRPFGLMFPELGAHPSDQYLFGDHLLVAPVVERGATSRDVILPPGDWIDWWTGARLEGGAGGVTVRVEAPLDVLPLFLRAGGVVPMLRPEIDTLAPAVTSTIGDGIESWANDRGLLYVRLALGPAGAFDVHDGAKVELDDTGITVTPGREYTTGFTLELVSEAEPAGVSVDGVPAARGRPGALDAPGWAYEAATGGTIWIALPAGTHRVELER